MIWGGGGGGYGGQVGCERRIEVFVKIQKKRLWGVGVRVDVNEELKFLGKLKKKNWGGGGGGVRVDVNGELKFLGKFTKKKFRGGGGGGSVAEGVRWGGGSGWWGVRVDVKAMLGVGVMCVWGM